MTRSSSTHFFGGQLLALASEPPSWSRYGGLNPNSGAPVTTLSVILRVEVSKPVGEHPPFPWESFLEIGPSRITYSFATVWWLEKVKDIILQHGGFDGNLW